MVEGEGEGGPLRNVRREPSRASSRTSHELGLPVTGKLVEIPTRDDCNITASEALVVSS